MSKLIELVEATWSSPLEDTVTEVYEVYKGDWVLVYSHSANPYWHTLEQWKTDLSEFRISERAHIMVLAGDRYVGHWENKEGFYDFLKNYLRAEITETVTEDIRFYDWVNKA